MIDPMHKASIERPSLALQKIRELRRRRRMMRSITGGFRWLVVVITCVWLMFLLDWFADLPMALRVGQIAATVTLLLITFRAILLAVRTPATEDQLASMVENASSELEDSLITAVQLTDPENPRRHLYNPELIKETVKIAESRIAHLRPGRLLSWRRAFSTIGLLFLLVCPAIVGGWLRPDLLHTFIERDILLGNAPWPRAYQLVVTSPEDTDLVVAKGTSLVIDVLKTRGGSARAFLDVVFPAVEGRREMREQLALDRKGTSGFRHVFQNLQRDIQFRVECGDFSGQWYSIQVRARPRIEEMALQYEFPEYTGLSSDGEDSRAGSGHVKAPTGTRVNFVARTSIDVKSAVRMDGRPSGDGEIVTESSISVEGGNTLRGDFIAEADGRWWISLDSEQGFTNDNPIVWRIAVIPDRAPEVSIDEPGQNIEITPRALLDLSVLVRDDYGVQSGNLIFEPELEGEWEPRVIALDEIGTSEILTADGSQKLQIDLASWQLSAGQRVHYRATATDALEQLGISRTWILSVLSEEELERVTQDELTLLKERLEETFSVQREVRRELEDLREALNSGQEAIDQAPVARHARGGQDRVSTRVEDAAERLASIAERLLRNRMSDASELAWIQDLKDRIDALGSDTITPAREQLERLAARSASGDATVEDADEAVDAARRVERGLSDVVADLQEWGDLRTVIRKIEELLRSEKDLEHRIEEKVREALGGDSTDGGNR